MQVAKVRPAISISPPKLRLEHIGKVFERDGNSVSVLEDLNLEVADGEFVCFVRSVGMRKVHAAQSDRRLSFAQRRLDRH